MENAEVEEEEFSEWEEIENSPRSHSTPNDANTPPSHRPHDSPEYSADDGESAGSVSSPTWRVVEAAKKVMKSYGICGVVDKIMSHCATRGRSFWSYSVGMLLVGSFVYVKLVRWCGGRRVHHEDKLNRLVLLLKEKDQKIRQLLQQIGRLNELLSSRRRVPVIRIA